MIAKHDRIDRLWGRRRFAHGYLIWRSALPLLVQTLDYITYGITVNVCRMPYTMQGGEVVKVATRVRTACPRWRLCHILPTLRYRDLACGGIDICVGGADVCVGGADTCVGGRDICVGEAYINGFAPQRAAGWGVWGGAWQWLNHHKFSAVLSE